MNLTIRNATVNDAQALLDIYAPYVINTAITYEYDVPSVQEFAERIENIQKKFPYLVAEVDGKIVGYSYAGTFHERKAYDCSAELSIYVAENCHGMGIGRSLYNELEKRLKQIGRTSLYACIAATSRQNDENLTDASIKFHTKLGFALVGRFTDCAIKFKKNYDMVYMEKHLL